MKLPVYELKISENLNDDSEVSYVALVDAPAIQKDFLAFKEEFINPSKGEHKDEFLPRCIKYVIDEGKSSEQAVAICNSLWDNYSFNFGGPGSGRNPEGGSNDNDKVGNNVTGLGAGVDNYVNYMETSDQAPGFKLLSDLHDENIDAYNVILKIDRNWQDNPLTESEKKVFDKMTTKKDYELYRGDTRYTINTTKMGDTLDFEKKPTFTSTDIEHSKYFAKDGVIVFEKGTTKSLKRKFDTAENSELISGSFIVTKIENGKIYAKPKTSDFKNQIKFQIISEDEHIISGPLMVANMPIYRNNEKMGEHYVTFSAETIKQIAIKFAKKKYQNHVNLMHDPNMAIEDCTMFESFIVDKKRGIMPMRGFEDIADGSWFASFYVENPEVWQNIKDGFLKGFSVEGMFDYDEPTKTLSAEEQALKKISELLNVII